MKRSFKTVSFWDISSKFSFKTLLYIKASQRANWKDEVGSTESANHGDTAFCQRPCKNQQHSIPCLIPVEQKHNQRDKALSQKILKL